jgi:phage protein D/phage baseplate assembly protein gpV
MPHGEEFSNTLLVKVDGTPLPDDVRPLLVNGYVDDSTNVPDLFVLRFSDEAGTVLAKGNVRIGSKVELSLQSTAPGGPAVLLEGEVTTLEVDVSEAGVHTVVRGLDASHRLFRGTRVEAYVNMTASDIVQKVAQRAGLKCKVDATSTLLDHTTQDGVNDWDFLRRLAQEHDRVLTMADGQLEFTARTPASEAPGGVSESRTDPLVLERGVNLVNLRGTITAGGQVPKVEVRGWDPKQKKEVVANEDARTLSAVPGGGLTPTSLAGTFPSPPYVVGLAGLDRQAAATSVAASLSDHLAGGFAELDGTARGNPHLRAGTAVQVVGVGDPFAGKYVLTSTRHEFEPEHGYRTTFTASNRSERSLYGVTSATSRERSRICGVVPAVVTSVQDPEHRGRVKIRLPWLADSYESWWARTVQAGAGKDRGAAVLPEVGDEVLVAFAQGDLEHPYVLGGLYNGEDVPHGGWAANIDGTSGQIIRRGFVSRKGMKVDLLERAGEEAIVLSTNDGAQRITVKQTAEKGIELVSEGPVKVQAKQAVEVTTSAGDVSLKGMNVKIEASGNLDLKGASVKVAGQATAELTSGATTTVKGAIVRIN